MALERGESRVKWRFIILAGLIAFALYDHSVRLVRLETVWYLLMDEEMDR
jgi:hypothetical protein